jgi:hypothetical protein
VRELRSAVSWWQPPHPAWRNGQGWPQEVSSYGVDDGERLLLFDPLAVPAQLRALARERSTTIVLIGPRHERDSQSLLGDLDAALFSQSGVRSHAPGRRAAPGRFTCAVT